MNNVDSNSLYDILTAIDRMQSSIDFPLLQFDTPEFITLRLRHVNMYNSLNIAALDYYQLTHPDHAQSKEPAKRGTHESH